ncbi:MAG TPA: FHA domain-containing protein [Dehalococcoidia bacterium]|nr:FHA domain-containing protein [Dehalococcoidia bacterium]
MHIAVLSQSIARPAIRLGMVLITCLLLSHVLRGGVAAQSPTPPPAPPGSGGTTFGSVRVLAGNNLPRNAGQENQPPVWLTVDTKGAAAVVTIGNATKVPLNFTGTVVMSLAPGARGVQVLVPVGSASIEGNQVVWTGFSLDSAQIAPAIVMLAPSGTGSSSNTGTTAVSEISVEAKDQQSGAGVTERVAGGGPTLAALASAPVNATVPTAPAAGTTSAAVVPLSQSVARTFGAWALGLMIAALAGILLIAWLVFSTGRRLERAVQAARISSSSGSSSARTIESTTAAQMRTSGGDGQPPADSQPAPAAQIEAIEGVDTGRRWILQRADTSVGRSDVNDVVLADRTVSERHARLTRQTDGSYVISDNGSTNGTLVNGQPLTEAMPLRQGDELRIGNIVLLFHDSAREPERIDGDGFSRSSPQ